MASPNQRGKKMTEYSLAPSANRILNIAGREFARVYGNNQKYILMAGIIRIKSDSEFLKNAVIPGGIDLRNIPKGGQFVFTSNPPLNWKESGKTFISFIGAFMDYFNSHENDLFPSQRGSLIPLLSESHNEKVFKFLQNITLFGCRPESIEEANSEIPFNVDAVKSYCESFVFPGDKSLDFDYVTYPVEFIRYVDGLAKVM